MTLFGAGPEARASTRPAEGWGRAEGQSPMHRKSRYFSEAELGGAGSGKIVGHLLCGMTVGPSMPGTVLVYACIINRAASFYPQDLTLSLTDDKSQGHLTSPRCQGAG